MSATNSPLIGDGLPDPAAAVRDRARMARALEVAASTPDGDVPVGAVVYAPDGESHNNKSQSRKTINEF